jgi:hypothetical protein
MENARSYASRLSGFAIFLIALAIVGVLVYLTVNSASDDDVAIEESAATVIDETEGVVTTDDGEGAVATTETNQDDETETVAAGDTTGTVAAAESTGNLPSTGPESALLSVLGLAAVTAAFVQYRRSQQLITIAAQNR